MNSQNMNNQDKMPKFDFGLPIGYEWLIQQNLVGFTENSQLQPWYFLSAEESFSVTDRWPSSQSQRGELIAFAKRQDCDDIACFLVRNERAERVVLVHGWTANGFDIVAQYDSFWDWLKLIIEDIAEWTQDS